MRCCRLLATVKRFHSEISIHSRSVVGAFVVFKCPAEILTAGASDVVSCSAQNRRLGFDKIGGSEVEVGCDRRSGEIRSIDTD